MASISGQAGTNLTSELADYLSHNQGNVTSEQLSSIINQYLSGGDKLGTQGGTINTGIYKRFGEYDQITGKVEVVTTGLWSGDLGRLETFFTESAQTYDNYYTNVYATDPAVDSAAEIQFAVSYGHIDGLGSVSLVNDTNATYPTKSTYAQYRSILLEQDELNFTFTTSSADVVHVSDDFYVINVARSRYRESMDPGNFAMTLSGSLGEFTFIDDSGKKFSDTVGKAGRVFNIVEGDLNLGTEDASTIISTEASNGEGYGSFYPDQGILVLNPSALSSKLGTVPGGSLLGDLGTDADKKNQNLLFESINLASSVESRRTENISTAHYFVRATNREYNYSNNPTFVTGSDGTFVESTFEKDPQTFITTIGLFSDANEMLAIAKSSQPIPKSFDKEVLIKIKLSF